MKIKREEKRKSGSDWHTKISASERVTLTGAARLRTLVFWELRKVLITLKYISCFVTSWAFHLSSLQVVARPLFSFLVSGQWGQEFLILCCGNAAASAATHWQFHNSSSCTGAFLPKTCQSCFGHKPSWHCIKIIGWWNFWPRQYCICGSHIVASRIEFDDETGAITGTSRDSSTMRVVFTIVQPPETAFVSFLGQTFQRSCTRASWSSNQN